MDILMLNSQALYKLTENTADVELLQDGLNVLLLGAVDECGIIFRTGQQGQLLSLLLLLAVRRFCVTLALLGIVADAGEFLLVVLRVVFSKVAGAERNVGQIIQVNEVVIVLINRQVVLILIVEFCKS